MTLACADGLADPNAVTTAEVVTEHCAAGDAAPSDVTRVDVVTEQTAAGAAVPLTVVTPPPAVRTSPYVTQVLATVPVHVALYPVPDVVPP